MTLYFAENFVPDCVWQPCSKGRSKVTKVSPKRHTVILLAPVYEQSQFDELVSF